LSNAGRPGSEELEEEVVEDGVDGVTTVEEEEDMAVDDEDEDEDDEDLAMDDEEALE